MGAVVPAENLIRHELTSEVPNRVIIPPHDPRAEFKARRMPDELMESLMDGLRKAGLDVPPADP